MKFSAIASILLATALIGCRPPAPRETTFTAGNATAHIAVGDGAADLLSTALSPTRRIFNNTWTAFDPDNRSGEIGKVNRMAGEYRLHISFDTFRALDLADYYGKLTGGAYDFTIAPLRDLWGFGSAPAHETPTDEEIAATRDLVGPDHFQLSEQGAISILTAGTRIAPGDLPYAYGTDLAILELRRRELGPALITWGNFTRALCAPGEKFSCRVPLPNPLATNSSLGTLDLAPDAALAIANLYAESVTLNGKRFGGILDPHTGRPAHGTLLVAVRAPTCTMAHVLAQALIVTGIEQGAALFENFPDCEALIIPDGAPLELWATPGFAEHLQLASTVNATLKEWNVSRPHPEQTNSAE